MSTRFRKLLFFCPRFWLCLLPFFLLVSCEDMDFFDTENEVILEGDRVTIFDKNPQLSPDPALEGKLPSLPPALKNKDWPQARGNPRHVLPHLALGTNLKKAWEKSFGVGSENRRILTTPVSARGVLYVMDAQGATSAFRQNSGKLLWQNEPLKEEPENIFFGGGLAISKGRVFATTGAAKIFALNASDGKKIWSQSVPAPIRTSPIVVGERMITNTIDNRTLVLSVDSGKLLWNHSGAEESVVFLGGASAASDGEKIWMPYSTGDLYTLDMQGEELWVHSLRRGGLGESLSGIFQIRAMPLVTKKQVFAISTAQSMVALSPETFKTLWEIPLSSLETPWLNNGVLYQLSSRNQLFAIQADTGRVFWSAQLPKPQGKGGKKVRTHWSGPILAGGRLVLVSRTGAIGFFSPKDGRLLQTIETGEEISVPPIVVNGDLILVTESAKVLVYR